MSRVPCLDHVAMPLSPTERPAPRRILLAWQLDSGFKYDPSLVTEVEVTFTLLGPKRTRVDFEHRNLERFGEAAERLKGAMGQGWGQILDSYVRAAVAAAA